MKIIAHISALFLVLSTQISGQNSDQIGRVTFIASENIYVKFNSTENISLEDTLFNKDAPCLRVIKKSSTSCICHVINDCRISVSDNLVHKRKVTPTEEIKDQETAPLVTPSESDDDQEMAIPNIPEAEELESIESVRGRASLASYSNFSPFEDSDRHRLIGRLSMNIYNIQESKFSVESYLNYRQNLEPASARSNHTNQLFRIYNLAVSYNIDTTLHLTLGRKINRNLASLGASDGLQLEKKFKNIVTGALVGFRPDFNNLGFNEDLFQYGVYAGLERSNAEYFGRSTIGLMEQRNAGAIDRRYLHVQNVQNLGRKVHLFGSMEMDLYSYKNLRASFDPRLTNLYLSARYRFNRSLSLTLAYDNRKQIILYESFRTEVEDLLADDIARQGLRLRMNYRFLKRISTGASYSKRFQSNSGNKSDNANAYVTISRIPIIDGTFSIRYNRNASNYLRSNIISSTLSFDSFKNKLNTQLYYRQVRYHYYSSEINPIQNYYGANIFLRMTRTLRFGLMMELSEREGNRFYRVNTKLTKRFRKG